MMEPPNLYVWPTAIDPAMVLCHATLFGEPAAWGRPRIEARGKKLRVLVNPASTVLGEALWRLELRQVWDGPPYEGAVGVRLCFSLHTRRRKDCDNLTKLVLDAATGEIWKDDSQVEELHCLLLRGSESPRTDLLVFRR